MFNILTNANYEILVELDEMIIQQKNIFHERKAKKQAAKLLLM